VTEVRRLATSSPRRMRIVGCFTDLSAIGGPPDHHNRHPAATARPNSAGFIECDGLAILQHHPTPTATPTIPSTTCVATTSRHSSTTRRTTPRVVGSLLALEGQNPTLAGISVRVGADPWVGRGAGTLPGLRGRDPGEFHGSGAISTPGRVSKRSRIRGWPSLRGAGDPAWVRDPRWAGDPGVHRTCPRIEQKSRSGRWYDFGVDLRAVLVGVFGLQPQDLKPLLLGRCFQA
jgi:hypothetical protein